MKNMKLWTVLLGLGILAGLLLGGCGGPQGAAINFSMTKPDGTIVKYESNKDISADSVKFNAATGDVELTKINSNGSKLSAAQAQVMLKQLQSFDQAVQEIIPLIKAAAGL
jgi:ABC-type glycerol-3-phosphate transport system substrate-binding protein